MAKKSKKSAPKKSAPKKPVDSVRLLANGKKKRWRNGAKKIIIKSAGFMILGGKKIQGIDPYSYYDEYTGEYYPDSLPNGTEYDSGYLLELPPPEDYTVPTEATVMVVDASDTSNEQTWFDYSSVVTDPSDPATATDELTVDLDYIDEFIEYYEPDPCESYRMSNTDGSFGIVG